MLNLEDLVACEVSFCSKDCNINVKFAEPVKCVKNNKIQLNIVRTYKHVKPSKDKDLVACVSEVTVSEVLKF